MKKIAILIFFIILSGCTCEYNLEYVNNEFKESLNILSTREEIIDGKTFKEYIDEKNRIEYNINYKIDSGELLDNNNNFYNKRIIDNNNNYGLELNYIYKNKKDYINSNIAYNLYKKISIDNGSIKSEDIRNIFSNYPYLEEITISFKTDQYVLNNNADYKKNNIYYWKINKDNYKNKFINIEFTNSEIQNYIKKLNNNSDKISDSILVSLITVIVFSTIFFLIKISKSNK